jgi:hypothetical protein
MNSPGNRRVEMANTDIWQNVTLRASAATAGTDEQSASVTIAETATAIWLVVDKTAEANADNLLTVRLQGQVNSVWFDTSWSEITTTGAVATAADTAINVTRTPNILDAYGAAATHRVLVYYANLPSNVLRIISVISGTTPAVTYSVESYFQRIAT